MLSFLSDEDFNNHIVRGLRRRSPLISVVRVQEVALSEAPDPDVLECAAKEGRVVLTHDAATMTYYAYKRIAEGLRFPGIVVISQSLPIGEAIEELLLLAECSLDGEWNNQVVHLPLR